MNADRWFITIVVLILLTLSFAYGIPNDSPFSVLKYLFGFLFIAFLPGYCLTTLLFSAKQQKLDIVEEMVLSVALSFGIVGLIGLFLGLSPIGLSFSSINFSLSPTVFLLALASWIRKRKLR